SGLVDLLSPIDPSQVLSGTGVPSLDIPQALPRLARARPGRRLDAVHRRRHDQLRPEPGADGTVGRALAPVLGRVRGVARLGELAAQRVARVRVEADVELVERVHAAVVDEHPRALV